MGNGKPHRIEPGLFHKNKSFLFLLILSLVQARSGSFSWLCFFSIFQKKKLKKCWSVSFRRVTWPLLRNRNEQKKSELFNFGGKFWNWVFWRQNFCWDCEPGNSCFRDGGGLPEIAELLPRYGDRTLHEAHTQWQTLFSKKKSTTKWKF